MKQIKICGLSDNNSVKVADEADYVGFVVGSKKSKRNISLKKFEKLSNELEHAKPVLVTVNHSLKFLHSLRKYKDTIIQLHGGARAFDEIIDQTALGLNFNEYNNQNYCLNKPHNFISVDTIGKSGYGGSGITWNWNKLKKNERTLLVAGGINFDNMETAIKKTGSDGVDVSSSIEINGKKSTQLISDFIDQVRGLK